MRRDLEAYLWDILKAISVINGYATVHTLDQFLADDFAQAAISKSFEIIGETMKQASRAYPGNLGTLPRMSEAIRFRDRLAHAYFATSPVVVWKAIEQELPPLKEAIEALLPPQYLP